MDASAQANVSEWIYKKNNDKKYDLFARQVHLQPGDDDVLELPRSKHRPVELVRIEEKHYDQAMSMLDSKRSFRNLTTHKVEFKFSGNFTRLGDNEFEKLVMNVPTNIAILKLDFGESEVTDKGVKVLADRMKDLTELYELQLSLMQNKGVTDDGLLFFAEKLAHKTSLGKINLDLRGLKASEATFKKLETNGPKFGTEMRTK